MIVLFPAVFNEAFVICAYCMCAVHYFSNWNWFAFLMCVSLQWHCYLTVTHSQCYLFLFHSQASSFPSAHLCAHLTFDLISRTSTLIQELYLWASTLLIRSTLDQLQVQWINLHSYILVADIYTCRYHRLKYSTVFIQELDLRAELTWV